MTEQTRELRDALAAIRDAKPVRGEALTFASRLQAVAAAALRNAPVPAPVEAPRPTIFTARDAHVAALTPEAPPTREPSLEQVKRLRLPNDGRPATASWNRAVEAVAAIYRGAPPETAPERIGWVSPHWLELFRRGELGALTIHSDVARMPSDLPVWIGGAAPPPAPSGRELVEADDVESRKAFFAWTDRDNVPHSEDCYTSFLAGWSAGAATTQHAGEGS